jgi:uncharacterized protein YqgC (DUF456 family)
LSIAEVILLVSTLFLMLVGLIGCLLPVLPGVPVIYVVAFVYAAITGFETIGSGFLIAFGILTVVTLILDNLAGVYGAKRFGATRWGMLGAILGMIIGLIFGSIIGMIIGPFFGAVLLELLAGKQSGQAFSAGLGTFVGFVGGTLLKIAVGVGMVSAFVYRVLWTNG